MRRVATVRQGDGRVAVRPGALPLPFGQSWSCWSGLQTYLVPATNSFSGRTLRFGTGTPLEGREEGPAAESQDRRWVRRARGRPWHSAGRSSCNSEPASLQVGFLAMFRALSRARCCVLCEV